MSILWLEVFIHSLYSMKPISKIIITVLWFLSVWFSSITFATVGQTIKYNFKALAEPSTIGWEDVVHPSDDASQSEVVVNTWWWSLVTITWWWTPIFWSTAFAGNGETVSDSGSILTPFAEFVLQSSLLNNLPSYPDYDAEFFVTWSYYPSFVTNGLDAFDVWVLNSNWSTQNAFVPSASPAANIFLTWLNPSKVYSFKMAGSLDDSVAWFLVWTTVYAVWAPQNSVLINTKWNTSHYATFAGISPNGQWEIPLWANAAYNPWWYIGQLWGIQVIESDLSDVPVIDFGTSQIRLNSPASSTTISANVTVWWWASITTYSWRQIRWPAKANILTPSSSSTSITSLVALWEYEFEVWALASNGIEQRKRITVVVDSGKWKNQTITNTNPLANDWQDIQYLVHLPDDYNNTWCENKRYPVIVYLHGFGQNGRDTEMLKGEGLWYLVDRWITDLSFTGASWQIEKFIWIIPQLSTSWPWDAEDIDAVIAYIMSGTNYRADYNRIYIAWFSYGSYGLWNYLSVPTKADQFAASVNSAYVPMFNWSYCNASWLPIFAMSEADMLTAWYYISSPIDYKAFMDGLATCPMNPPVTWWIMTWRSHVEMYNFYWQLDYTWFEWKNIYNWFLWHERNYMSGWAWQACFTYAPSPWVDILLSPSIQTVLPNWTASFTVTVINTGNSDLTWLTITSNTVPNCATTIPYLAMWTSTWYQCNVTNVVSSFTNALAITWYVYHSWVTYTWMSASDTIAATVNVASFIPALQIIQTPQTLNIQSWDNVSLTLFVTNTWDVDLSWIVLTNSTIPTCNNTLWYLAQWATYSYSCALNNVQSSFTTTTYGSWYAYSGGVLLPWYPTATNASTTVIVTSVWPAANPVVDIDITPSSQTITAGQNASFTVTVTNTWNVDLSWVVVSDPTASWCDTIIWYLPVGWTAWYSCQQNAVPSSFVTTIYTTWYMFSGWVEYTWNIIWDMQSASITVNPIIVVPPHTSNWAFAWGGMWVASAQTMSTLPQTTPSLSTLPVQPKPKPIATPSTEPELVITYPDWNSSQITPMGDPTITYAPSSNGSSEYKLPFDALRQLLASLTQ